MPTALRIEAYRFFFYAGDARERMHIHVRRNRKEAKFWLEPICLARNCGFSAHELNRIEHLAARHAQTVMDAWHDYFGP
jgi:hypothetical protein